jgi:hypothetical protein
LPVRFLLVNGLLLAGKMLVELTKVTRENLQNVEGSLWALWATAQQINARQKVDVSIRCVFLFFFSLTMWI